MVPTYLTGRRGLTAVLLVAVGRIMYDYVAASVRTPPPAEVIAQSVASGLLMGCIYALIAVGLTLIFGLMEIVNFAHGEFLMLAMFSAFWLSALFGLDPLVSLPICAALLFVVGLLTYKGIISRVLRAPMLAQIMATFGLGVFLRSAAQFLWSPDYRVIQNPLLAGRVSLPGDVFIGRPQLVASLVALLAFAGLWLLVNRTELGLALRATSEDREAATLMGINAEQVFALSWGIGALCVGVAGALMANFFYIFPDVGFLFGLIAYVAVALGGFGSIAGALVAGVVIGLVEGLSGLFIAPALKYVAVFSLYLIVVLARPQGLFGRY